MEGKATVSKMGNAIPFPWMVQKMLARYRSRSSRR